MKEAKGRSPDERDSNFHGCSLKLRGGSRIVHECCGWRR